MGEGQQEQRRAEGEPGELAALTARVAALEGEIADLRSRLSAQGAGARGRTELQRPSPSSAADVAAPDASLADSRPAVSSSFVAASASPAMASSSAPRESLERRLGSQVFSRVGILVVLIGAALFLKLAIDNQWIGPVGRVLAGLIAGTGLVVWSERFRRHGYGAFSYTLKAAGSGVLYLALWAAFQIYHLLPAGAAFTAMLLVTAWNAYMAWVQDAEGLAAYALVGGFATPLLLSTGGNHEIFLFAYILAIDIATVVLVRVRGWARLLLGVFPATVGFFIGWYAEYYRAEELAITSLFITLFFMVFVSVPLRMGAAPAAELPDAKDAKKEPRRTSVIGEVLLPLANAAFGSLAFYSVLQDADRHSWLPWMVVVFAAGYLGLMRLPQSAAASAVHLSLSVVFLTVAVPLKASGHWITVSWLVEGTALLWASARLAAAREQDDSPAEAHRVLRVLAQGALLLGFGGLLTRIYGRGYDTLPAFWNHRFATAMVGVAAYSMTVWIALRAHAASAAHTDSGRREHEQQIWLQIAGVAIIFINVIAVLATVREIAALWLADYANPEAELRQALAISAFLMLYGGGLLAVGFWKRTAFIRWQALLLIVFTIGKTFVYDLRNLSQGYRVASFLALGALLLGVSFAYQNNWLALRGAEPEPSAKESK